MRELWVRCLEELPGEVEEVKEGLQLLGLAGTLDIFFLYSWGVQGPEWGSHWLQISRLISGR